MNIKHQNKTLIVNYLDLCMAYEWKCYLNDHILMLQPKKKWINFHNKNVAEFAKEIIETEVNFKLFK